MIAAPPLAAAVRREFPTVPAGGGGPGAVEIDLARWHDPTQHDRAVDAATRTGYVTFSLRGGTGLDAVALVTRYQRLIDRRNAASAGPTFDQVLAAHAGLHDVSRPLVRADLDHALDTWQWLLRLDPEADAATQIAALFHDVERLVSEADERREQDAEDYDAYKDAHAGRGATLARAALAGVGLDEKTLARACALISGHERPGGEHARRLLCDADALSFFSQNSSGFLDYFGEAHTRRKIAWTLARLSPPARARLPAIRLRPDVASLLEESQHG